MSPQNSMCLLEMGCLRGSHDLNWLIDESLRAIEVGGRELGPSAGGTYCMILWKPQKHIFLCLQFCICYGEKRPGF